MIMSSLLSLTSHFGLQWKGNASMYWRHMLIWWAAPLSSNGAQIFTEPMYLHSLHIIHWDIKIPIALLTITYTLPVRKLLWWILYAFLLWEKLSLQILAFALCLADASVAEMKIVAGSCGFIALDVEKGEYSKAKKDCVFLLCKTMVNEKREYKNPLKRVSICQIWLWNPQVSAIEWRKLKKMSK